MTTPITVAVFIDRGEAIRAGFNKWNWQNTELDLEALDTDLREALSRCPEKDGAVQVTHCDDRPGSEVEKDWFIVRELRDGFEVERDGMPPLVEASPSSALAMLKHLASLPARLRGAGEALLASARESAGERSAQAMEQAQAHLAELDRWLATSPDLLVTERKDFGAHPDRFQRIEAPPRPATMTMQDEQIAYDMEEAGRLLEGQCPRVADIRPGEDRPTDAFRAPRQRYSAVGHLAAVETELSNGIEARAEAVRQHRVAVAAAAMEFYRVWEDAWQRQVQEERQRAAITARQVLDAHREAASNRALREWAIDYDKGEILELLDNGAPPEHITDRLRTTLFKPLERFPAFRKIRKQDLLIANPNLGEMAMGVEAAFEDVEEEFVDPVHRAMAQAIIQACIEASMPAQFGLRLHRGRLTRRGDPIGTSLEARSLLVTARFGSLSVSRAFAIGGLAPTNS